MFSKNMQAYSLILIIISLSLYFCSERNITEFDPAPEFGFYLLESADTKALEAQEVSLNELSLVESPFLSIDDIHSYDWENHSFNVRPSVAETIRNICSDQESVFGIPFVVKVNNDRIYLAAFWFLHSSIAPTLPHIDALFNTDNLPERITIRKSWDTNVKIDLRDDRRIFTVLKENNKLLE